MSRVEIGPGGISCRKSAGTLGVLLALLLLPCVRGTAGQTGLSPAVGTQASTAAAESNAVVEARAAAGRLRVIAYDLEVHLRPAESGLSAAARLTVRNEGTEPVRSVALELSSALNWEAISARVGDGAPTPLRFEQARVETDADHTGAESEALVTLAQPLSPGATVTLTAYYSGMIARSTARAERTGASAAEAELADWDEVAAGGTFLRGYGDVLWYPVLSPPVFQGAGASFAEALAAQRRTGLGATARLRLVVEGVVANPASVVFFCGRIAPLIVLDGARQRLPVDGEAPGGADVSTAGDGGDADSVATAEFPAAPIGFGVPSLFLAAPAPVLTDRTVGVITLDSAAAQRVETAATSARGLVTEWLGALPERQAYVLDHAGVPFAQGALLVESATEAESSFAVIRLLGHAWFASRQVWLDEGVAQFLPLVALERARGRSAALARLADLRPALVLAESNAGEAGGHGEALATSSREVMYRNKAVAVLSMLRDLVGDDAMRAALQTLRSKPVAERDGKGFELALEASSHKELAWFFRDWVYEDRGLPELTIANATARAAPNRTGVGAGTLVVVEVRNDGGAAAEVPVTVRSGELNAVERLRVPAHGTASIRIGFQGQPETVEVNDGSVPELSEARHSFAFGPVTKP